VRSVTPAALSGAGQASRLAAVIARTGLDPWDAHVAAVADVAICPILTLDARKWQQPAAQLDEPLHIVEISDPSDGDPGT
jgi:predicted nucleic acid-binding protein